jgi:hypothetical protein
MAFATGMKRMGVGARERDDLYKQKRTQSRLLYLLCGKLHIIAVPHFASKIPDELGYVQAPMVKAEGRVSAECLRALAQFVEDTEGTGEDTEDTGEDTEGTGEDTEGTGEDTEDTGEDTEDTGEDTEDTGEDTEDDDASWQTLDDCLYVRECGGGGDCLFHVIAYAISTSQATYSAQDVRFQLAQSLTDTNLKVFLETTDDRQEALVNLREQKFPNDTALLQAVHSVVRQPGFTYQGDDLSLLYLQQHGLYESKGVQFVVFLQDEDGKVTMQCPPSSDVPRALRRYIFLLNVNDYHWRLLAVRSGGRYAVQVEAKDVPECVKAMYRQTCLRTDGKPQHPDFN